MLARPAEVDPTPAGTRSGHTMSEAERRRRRQRLALFQDRVRGLVAERLARWDDLEGLAEALAVLGRDGRVRLWAIPPGFPQRDMAAREAAASVLAHLIRRVDGVLYGLVLLGTSADWPERSPALLAWAQAHELPAAAAVVHVADSERRSTGAALLLPAEQGRRQLGPWRERWPLEAPFAALDGALVVAFR
jgi:hypothetical protein